MKKVIIILAILCVLVIVFVVRKNSANAPQGSLTPTPTKEANITVTSPKAGDTVTNPITVTGKARVFENTFAYRLIDFNGQKLYENHAMADAPDTGLFGDFSIKIPVPLSDTQNLIIEVFEYSAKDGSIINLVRVPVKMESLETSTVKVYFTKKNSTDCTAVFPVDRIILKTKEVGYLALFELFKGLATIDKASYTTTIPADVRINSLTIRGDTAYADFDETLLNQVSGSCRVTAIRAQITQTLKQFPTIKNVVISVNGHTEDILQP